MENNQLINYEVKEVEQPLILKVGDFVQMAPSMFKLKTIDKQKQFYNHLMIKAKTKKPSDIVVENDFISGDQEFIDDHTKPINYFDFFEQAPTIISTKNNQNFRQFKEKIRIKKIHKDKKDHIEVLTQFSSSAFNQIKQQNTQRCTQFMQSINQKKQQKLVKQNLQIFLQRAPKQLLEESNKKYSHFSQTLKQKAKQQNQTANEVVNEERDKKFHKLENLQEPVEQVDSLQIEDSNITNLIQEQDEILNAQTNNQSIITKLDIHQNPTLDFDEQKHQSQNGEITLPTDQQALETNQTIISIAVEEPRTYKQFGILSSFVNQGMKQLSQQSTSRVQQMMANLSTQSKLQIEIKKRQSEADLESNRTKDISEIVNQQMDDQSILKSAFQEHSMSEEIQIIELMEHPGNKKKLRHHPQAEFRRQLNEDLEHSRYLNEKEQLKMMLQKELEVISHEIREMRGQQQYSIKTLRKSNLQKSQIQDMDDDHDPQHLALDLVKRMNLQRRERRLRQKQQYSKLENYMRDEIDKLRSEQDVNYTQQIEIVSNQMDQNRKLKIQKRIDDYNKRQMQFCQMQQANQEFIRNLLNQGPQEGQLAHQFDEKIHQIQGKEVRRKIRLKQGAIIYLPSINNKQERNIFQHQREKINIQQMKPRLPKLNQDYTVSERLMQAELERVMIRQYKESKKNLLQNSLDC